MLPDDTHPAIKKKIDELREQMQARVTALEEDVSDLKGSLALPGDFHGIKMRSSSVSAHAIMLIRIAEQIEALSNIPYDMRQPVAPGSPSGNGIKAKREWSQRDRGEQLLDVLDWVLEEQMAGRRPNTIDVANHFGISIEESEKIHKDLEDAGEFD